ncbi:MAG: ubiquitin-conjugating enzyme family protein [Candidatus Ranarchaeia archaeon]
MGDPHFRRLRAEFGRLIRQFHPETSKTKWKVLTNDLHKYVFWIHGYPNTPYEGGVWEIHIELPPEYPIKPPIVNFVTKIWHPNIAVGGRKYQWGSNVCLSLINWNIAGKEGGWKPTIFLTTVVEHLDMMLEVYKAAPGDEYPEYIVNPSDPFNKQAGVQMLNNWDFFEKTASDWKQKHAMSVKIGEPTKR